MPQPAPLLFSTKRSDAYPHQNTAAYAELGRHNREATLHTATRHTTTGGCGGGSARTTPVSIQDLRDYAPGKQKGKGRAQERGAALEAAAGKVSASLASPAGRGVTR